MRIAAYHIYAITKHGVAYLGVICGGSVRRRRGSTGAAAKVLSARNGVTTYPHWRIIRDDVIISAGESCGERIVAAAAQSAS